MTFLPVLFLAIAPVLGSAAFAQPVEPPAICHRAPGEFDTADDLLLALEKADADLASLTADITYDRVFEIAGDRQIRKGRLYFVDPRNDPGANQPGAPAKPRKFAIDFKTLQVGNRIDQQDKIMIFDGKWLVEKMPKDKQFIKRQVVAEGEKFDPLRVGEGPFPLPIGQKRDDILARYDAQLLPAEDGVIGQEPQKKPKETEALIAHVKGSAQLKLTPKAARADSDEFTEIRLWYFSDPDHSNRLLPKMARTINRAGDISIVRLDSVMPNSPVPADVLDTSTPPKDWDARVEELPPPNRR